MKLSWILFALLLGMCLTLAYLLTVEEVPDGHGFTHPQYETMQRGGDGEKRHSAVLVPGWILGTLMAAFFVGLVALGARRGGGLGSRRWAFVIGFLLYGAVWTFLVLTYRSYAAADSRPLFLAFPLPTAWMLYGLWPVPLYFLVLYVAFFDRWILKEEDLEKFKRMVEARRQEGGR